MTRWRRAAVLLAGLVCPLWAHADCKLEMLELPIRMAGSRAVATVGINGTTVPLTVDSGAFYSSLTEAAAAQLKLRLRPLENVRVEGLTGRVESYTTRVDKLELLKGEIPRVEFLVGGNEPGAGTMGLMGRNILSFTDTEYDLAHGMIRFLFPGEDCARGSMAYWAGTAPVTEVELVADYDNRKTPAIRARVKLDGREFTALLDTGAHTLVSLRAARRAGITEAALTPVGTMYGAGRGSAKLWTAPFEKFEIGGESIEHNRLQVADVDLAGADMLLGIDFFLSHRIYVSKQQSKMFLTYTGGRVFALNHSAAASAPAFDSAPAASAAPADTADAIARRGAALAARGQYAAALADLDRACELDPASADFLAQRGALQQTLRRPRKALDDFDKALQLDPAHADARFRRAVLRHQAGDRDGAGADLTVLDTTLAPQAQMRLAMSGLYASLDQLGPALAQLNQWLPAHPHEATRAGALNSRCWLRLRLGTQLNEALDDCDDAVDSDGKNAAYLDSRGWVYLKLGKYKKSVDDFDRSLAAVPDGAWSLYGRALAKSRLGDAAGADADLGAAHKVLPDIDVRAARAGLTPEVERKP